MNGTVEEEVLQTLASAILATERQAERLENAYYWAFMSARGHQPPEKDSIRRIAARMSGKAQE